MKLSRNNIEGTDIEIINFFKNNGFDVAQFFNPNVINTLKTRWIILPASIFIALGIVLCFISQYPNFIIPISILSFAFGFWTIISLHLRFRNWFISSFSLLFLIIIMGLATKHYTIDQVLDHLLNAQKKLDTTRE